MRIFTRLGVNQTGKASPTMIVVAVVVVVALIGWYFFYPRPAPEAPLPVVEPEVPATAEERGDTARDVIAILQAGPDGVDYAEAFARAKGFADQGLVADATLLYFFAARGGYGPAAADLARMYDPVRFDAGASLMDKPDPFQAYKWYQTAAQAGDESAQEHLTALKAWAESASLAGDMDAERLLLQWE